MKDHKIKVKLLIVQNYYDDHEVMRVHFKDWVDQEVTEEELEVLSSSAFYQSLCDNNIMTHSDNFVIIRNLDLQSFSCKYPMIFSKAKDLYLKDKALKEERRLKSEQNKAKAQKRALEKKLKADLAKEEEEKKLLMELKKKYELSEGK